MQLIISSRSVRGNGGRVEAGDAVYYLHVFEGLLTQPVLTPKTVGAALVELFAVILPVEATTPLVNALPAIPEASMVCVTFDVMAATTTTAAVMAPSIPWAFISSLLARLRRVEGASPGDRGRFLLSSMAPIVTGEIPGPILHCGRCHTLDTPCPGRSDVFASRCCPVFLGNYP